MRGKYQAWYIILYILYVYIWYIRKWIFVVLMEDYMEAKPKLKYSQATNNTTMLDNK